MVDELDKALNDVERITKEYGEFAYIVSHDFAAPLRHVREFTRLLLASTNEELNEEQQEYKDFVDRSLDKLDGMQNSMLTFSRINTQGAEFTQTETAKLVESALALLDTEIKDSDANVEFENLPSVKADTNQLQTVFFELISNGIKFHREGVPAAVTVSAQSANDEVTFTVEDNGIGIEEGHYESVFKLFRSLHPDTDYPGMGTGLTIAQKIVERHNGKMWVESVVDQGTKIMFTLPVS